MTPLARTPAQVRRRFEELLASGARLLPAGAARRDPSRLTRAPYIPRHELHLFGTTLFLTDQFFDPALGFFVGYVVPDGPSGAPVRKVYPRVFYKDSSLMWRVASHYVHDEHEYWIGKGEAREETIDGERCVTSAEETTDLPFELQFAIEEISRRRKKRRNDGAVALVVREAPSGRIAPYTDFTRPRRASEERYAIHRGRPIARFRRQGDPSSLEFAGGYEPDFREGRLESCTTESRFFGGRLEKHRILSSNRRIQYLFFASPTHVWLTHPQALSTELSTYAVRMVDVRTPEYLALPGYEYHEDGLSQIPEGFAGPPHPDDPHRADASAWLDELPVVRAFRAQVLGR